MINPRLRNRHIHDEITQNIRAVGLKKPITVRKINKGKGKFEYALICGQGRLESFIVLGQSKIPAFIKTVDEHDGQLMSLVENIARRNPRATELLERVKDMIASGLSDVEIAARLGYSVQWVEREMASVQIETQKLEEHYAANNLKFSIAKSHIEALLNNSKVLHWLIDNEPEYLNELKKISNINSLNSVNGSI